MTMNAMNGLALAQLAALASVTSGYGMGIAGDDLLMRERGLPRRNAAKPREYQAFTHTEAPKGKRAKRRARGKRKAAL